VNLTQHISIWLLRGYQRALSPALAALAGPMGRCRFEPSCSQYAVEAIQTHGTVKGIGLAAWRICRCAPWGGCGHDPVPPVKFKVQSLKFEVSEIQAGNIRHDGAQRAQAGSGART
jgi:putative membrane protein insertion efficiency factor